MASPPLIFSPLPPTIALYSVYNEEDLLDSSLMSVAPYVKRIVVADGPFDTWPSTEEGYLKMFGSVDKTPLILQKWSTIFKDNLAVIAHGPMREKDVRESLFHSIAQHEVGLVIDGDEIVFGDVHRSVKTFADSEQHYGMVNVLQARGAIDQRPRLFKPTGWKWRTWFKLEDEDGCYIDLNSYHGHSHLIPHFRIVNLHLMFRKKEREEMGLKQKETAMKKGWVDT